MGLWTVVLVLGEPVVGLMGGLNLGAREIHQQVWTWLLKVYSGEV